MCHFAPLPQILVHFLLHCGRQNEVRKEDGIGGTTATNIDHFSVQAKVLPAPVSIPFHLHPLLTNLCLDALSGHLYTSLATHCLWPVTICDYIHLKYCSLPLLDYILSHEENKARKGLRSCIDCSFSISFAKPQVNFAHKNSAQIFLFLSKKNFNLHRLVPLRLLHIIKN